MKNAFRDERGVSLFETVIVIGLMVMITFIETQIFLSSYTVAAKQGARGTNDIGATLLAQDLSTFARGADAVMASQTVDGTSYTSSASALVLEMPSIDASNNIIAGSHDYMAFAPSATDPTKIFVDVQGAPSSKRITGKRLITANNSILIFRYNDTPIQNANRVSVYLENAQTIHGVTLTTHASTSIFLRNK